MMCYYGPHAEEQIEPGKTVPVSEGAADADVQAEVGQAKEGAWELFTG